MAIKRADGSRIEDPKEDATKEEREAYCLDCANAALGAISVHTAGMSKEEFLKTMDLFESHIQAARKALA